VLVIDLTHVLNGPFATSLLSDLGARVVKVEPPGVGDETRTWGPFLNNQSVYFSFVNRGKESIVLNLRDPKDREIFLNMVRQADVLTENFRPGVMARLGFSYSELSQINPRLVYVSSTGFGQTGPFASFPAYDTIIQGMSGIMSMTGFPDGPPTRVGTALSDLCGGVFMFCGLASALYAREKTGNGSHVDVAMFDARLLFLEDGLMESLHTASRSTGSETGIGSSRLSMCFRPLTRTLSSAPEMTTSSTAFARSLDGRISSPTTVSCRTSTARTITQPSSMSLKWPSRNRPRPTG
jgi:CoA:oxalate CoA-transferase